MKKFRIDYTMETYYEVEIEAETKEEALAKFHSLSYDNSREVGGGLQDSVTVEEVGE